VCRLTAPWLAGASVDIALFPLDCLKTRMQVVKLDTSFACNVSPTLGSVAWRTDADDDSFPHVA
jgi:hypothetical protein